MKCPKCASENHTDACFCARCGEPLAVEPPTPPESIEVHIEGGVSGQVAIGNNILQIGNVYGGMVNVAMPEQKPQPRPCPILHFEQADNFVLAYYAGGETQPKGVPFTVEPEIEPETGDWTILDQRGPRVSITGDVSGQVAVGGEGTLIQFGDISGGRVVVGEKAIK